MLGSKKRLCEGDKRWVLCKCVISIRAMAFWILTENCFSVFLASWVFRSVPFYFSLRFHVLFSTHQEVLKPTSFELQTHYWNVRKHKIPFWSFSCWRLGTSHSLRLRRFQGVPTPPRKKLNHALEQLIRPNRFSHNMCVNLCSLISLAIQDDRRARFFFYCVSFHWNWWILSDIIENDIDGGHAIQILRKIAANNDLREVTLVAKNDRKK